MPNLLAVERKSAVQRLFDVLLQRLAIIDSKGVVRSFAYRCHGCSPHFGSDVLNSTWTNPYIEFVQHTNDYFFSGRVDVITQNVADRYTLSEFPLCHWFPLFCFRP